MTSLTRRWHCSWRPRDAFGPHSAGGLFRPDECGKILEACGGTDIVLAA